MASALFRTAPFFKRTSSNWVCTHNYLNSWCAPKVRTLKTDAHVISSEEKLGSVDGVTLPELLWSNLHKWENDKAFDCAVTGRTYTHGEVYKKSRSFSTAVLQSGLKRNDVVGIVLPNIPETAIVYVGIWDAGLIASPVNPNYLAAEIAKQMISCEAKAVVTLPQFAVSVKEAKKSCPKLKSIIVIGEAQDCHLFFDMAKVNSTGTEFLKGSQITNDDVALLPYSSGTTGPPKGVMLTHKNIGINLLQFSTPDFHLSFNEGGGRRERLIGVLLFFHIYGFNCVLASTLYQGHFTTCIPKFEPKFFVETMRKHKPTSLHLVPHLVNFMIQSPEIGKKEVESLHAVFSGAAPIGRTIILNFLEKFGQHILFQECYGMTEMSPLSHMVRKSKNNSKLTSCGSVMPGSICKIVDGTGQTLGPNFQGELCVKGPQVMKGYFRNEKATNETIDSEGWIQTGVIAVYDEDECFYIVDRLKELIKVKGFQVAPAELEDILRKHPQVADVDVIGIPDNRIGEAPRAYIVKNGEVLETEIQNM